jgi:DNA-directed RNA polymerase subunit RPC12/RpoP
MNTESTLIDIAVRLKESFGARETALQRELQELEARQTAIRDNLRLAANATDRLSRYRPGSSGDYRCPYCWMQREQLPPLYAIGGGTRDEDLRCSECKQKITVSFR